MLNISLTAAVRLQFISDIRNNMEQRQDEKLGGYK